VTTNLVLIVMILFCPSQMERSIPDGWECVEISHAETFRSAGNDFELARLTSCVLISTMPVMDGYQTMQAMSRMKFYLLWLLWFPWLCSQNASSTVMMGYGRHRFHSVNHRLMPTNRKFSINTVLLCWWSGSQSSALETGSAVFHMESRMRVWMPIREMAQRAMGQAGESLSYYAKTNLLTYPYPQCAQFITNNQRITYGHYWYFNVMSRCRPSLKGYWSGINGEALSCFNARTLQYGWVYVKYDKTVGSEKP